jgi:uncharacterized membrane protein
MRSQAARALRLGLLLCAGFAVSCTSREEEGAPTGSLCDSTLSYVDDFAPIMERYCSRCHAASVPLKERHGAPGGSDFDSEAAVIEHALEIQMRAGFGPEAENRSMPPKGSHAPSDEQRRTISRFLTCHLESGDDAHAHHH